MFTIFFRSDIVPLNLSQMHHNIVLIKKIELSTCSLFFKRIIFLAFTENLEFFINFYLELRALIAIRLSVAY